MHNVVTQEPGMNLETMSPAQVLALGRSVLKQAFYGTPTGVDDGLLKEAFRLRQIASDKGVLDV